MDPTIPTTREKQLTEPSPSFRRASSIGSEPISPRAVKPSALDGLAEGFSEALDFCRPTDVAVAMHPVLFSEVLSQALGRLSGLRVISCDPGEKGVTRIRKLKPRVLVLDEEDLERAGNLLRHLSQILPTTRILVMAGQSSSTRQQKMLRSGQPESSRRGPVWKVLRARSRRRLRAKPKKGTRPEPRNRYIEKHFAPSARPMRPTVV